MSKKQGKIRAIGIDVPKVGTRVLLNNTIYKIANWNGIQKKFVLRNNNYIAFEYLEDNSELKQLVVEYEKENHNDFPSIIQISLKYSQWQSAIDNGEVDSDKIVEFEEIAYLQENIVVGGRKVIAKIITIKKKMYSEEDMISFANYIRGEDAGEADSELIELWQLYNK